MKLRELPTTPLDPKVVSYWRVCNSITSAIGLVIAVLIFASSLLFDGFNMYIYGAAGFVLGIVILNFLCQQLVVIPLKYTYTKYSLNISDIDKISGVFVRTRRVVPFKRVQSVSTENGPILRHFGLSNLEVSTAESIPFILEGLDKHTAEVVRQRISALARSAQEDV